MTYLSRKRVTKHFLFSFHQLIKIKLAIGMYKQAVGLARTTNILNSELALCQLYFHAWSLPLRALAMSIAMALPPLSPSGSVPTLALPPSFLSLVPLHWRKKKVQRPPPLPMATHTRAQTRSLQDVFASAPSQYEIKWTEINQTSIVRHEVLWLYSQVKYMHDMVIITHRRSGEAGPKPLLRSCPSWVNSNWTALFDADWGGKVGRGSVYLWCS